MKIQTCLSAVIAQEHHKKHFNKSVRNEPKYSSDGYVLAYVPVGQTFKEDERAQEILMKLKPRKHGPFNVISVHLHTTTSDKDSIENTGYIYRLSLARRDKKILQLAATAEQEPVERVVSSETPSATPPNEVEYVVGKIIGHSGPPIDRRYTVHWYGLAPEDNTARQSTTS